MSGSGIATPVNLPTGARMSYKDVRDQFVKISGRYDLITSTEEDNGADFFLNSAQRYLDRFFDGGKAWARYPVALAAGEYIAKTVDIRAIKEVWIANADGKSLLEKTTLQELQSEYSEGFAYVDRGTPGYYAPAVFRPAPDTLASSTGLYGVDDLLLYNATNPAQHFNYNGVVIMPPPDVAYTVEILGLFYSPVLSATLSGGIWTNTISYWTEVHPEVLIEAALYKLNALYQNDSGAVGYKNTVLEDVTGIIGDTTEEDIAGSSLQMGG